MVQHISRWTLLLSVAIISILLIVVTINVSERGAVASHTGSNETTDHVATSREPILIEQSALWGEMPLEELVQISDLIIKGEVLTPHPSRWSTTDGILSPELTVNDLSPDMVIFTDTPVRVDKYLKGSTIQRTILVRTLGGQVGIDEMVTEAPELRPGEQVILFLTKDVQLDHVGPEHYILMQGPLGKFVVEGATVRSVPTRFRGEQFPLEELLGIIASVE